MSADEKTIAFYDAEAPKYAPWSAPDGDYAWLDKFLALTPEKGVLLDYGCGGGWAAKRMVDAGRSVEAFDGSAGLAAEAAALTGLDVRIMRFEEFDEPARFDGVWASFCLLHAPRAAMPGNLRAIAAALRPGGVFYLGLKLGDGERRDSLGRHYSYFQPDEITALLTEAGFTGVDIRRKQGGGYDGQPDEVMHIFCDRA